jgi:hypothetical protein
MDPWFGPFEQDGHRVYRMDIQWTDRWTTGIAAMVSLDLANMQPICQYATPLPLSSHAINQLPSLCASVVITLSTKDRVGCITVSIDPIVFNIY